MPYANNRTYNTRNSGRYNTPGQFVAAGELSQQASGGGQGGGLGQLPRTPASSLFSNNQPVQQQPMSQMSQLFGSGQQQQQSSNLVTLKQEEDVDMSPAVGAGAGAGTGAGEDGGEARPHWMKSKLQGVKKISNKERRRRQNENLRRLLTPKNALMVLNEMMPGEQLTNQFKVEPSPAQYYGPQQGSSSFCADLTVEGHNYKGYGENKITARNAAAEQAIRDIIIKRMAKVLGADANSTGSQNGDAEDETLPMIQLASFALHKLFSEWEYEGHKVPQLKPANAPPQGEGEAAAAAAAAPPDAAAAAATPRRVPRKSKAPKELPADAASMHPCMLLTYMRPQLVYRELCASGDRPQTMLYTVGVDVDNATYIGKASNKKEARKAAATAACSALFGVSFGAPAPAPPAPAQPAA